MAKIERALSKIQIQKPAPTQPISQSEEKKNGRKTAFNSLKANRTGHSVNGGVIGSADPTHPDEP